MAVAGQFGLAANTSDGTATVVTGSASAVGNDASTVVGQTIDPVGLAVQTQTATVHNTGTATANTGFNRARGNASDNDGNADPGASLAQGITIDPVGVLDVGTLVLSNNGEASNTSDGTASIATGDASATGNHSNTAVWQDAEASGEGLGVVINAQAATVDNIGDATANSGFNFALGNRSQNDAALNSTITAVPDGLRAGILAVSISAAATNSSDGTATIVTGAASAAGNTSDTVLSQGAAGNVDGLGLVTNVQNGGVRNDGTAIANSGVNAAIGNTSDNETDLGQGLLVGDVLPNPANDVTAAQVTLSSAGEASNASDGTAAITTGRAHASGNRSSTLFEQKTIGDVQGLGAAINVQTGGVANIGGAGANSGVNGAIGNVANNGAQATQQAEVNPTGDALTVTGSLVASNAGEAANASDGTATIHTGAALANGNVSTTEFDQTAAATIGEDGLGVVPNIQTAGVVNFGLAGANSGVNGAVGNAADVLNPNPVNASLNQAAALGADPGFDLTINGSAFVSNSGAATNNSDGTAKVRTGDATAAGNTSSSNLTQHLDADVDGLGLVVGPQTGAIVNTGVGVANSGVNGAIGNASTSTATAGQSAEFAPDGDLTVNGPIVSVGNSGEASNTSDGAACVCTGNATASGNTSSSSLLQDMDLSVDNGVSVITTTGLILNSGFGLANSGVNLAIGNLSTNTATATQLLGLSAAAAPGTLTGPQVFNNGGGADNTSAGTGKVGTGNAKADGNISTSELTQAVQADGAGTFAAIDGGIANNGNALANSGVNLGLGNRSTNTATLEQEAEGAGTVANNGRASNASDGFGGVGDPDCDDVTAPPPPADQPPGMPSLPKTGGFLEVEAAVGLMLLLAGFGLRRASRQLGHR